jgi:hypothetical protein
LPVVVMEPPESVMDPPEAVEELDP